MARGSPLAEDVVAVVERRIELLEFLFDPRLKGDVVAGLDVSRSTVDRAVRELEQYGLVCRRDGEFVATELGRTVARSYRAFRDRSTDVVDAREALSPLSPDVSLDAAVVGGATTTVVGESRPFTPPAEVRETLETADSVRAVFGRFESPQLLRGYLDLLDSGHTPLSMVVDEPIFETLRDRPPDALREMALRGDASLRTTDCPPYTLVLTDRDGERTVTVVVYDTPGVPHAVLQNDSAAALSWAERTVSRFERAGERASIPMTGEPATATAGPAAEGGVEAEGFVALSPAVLERRDPAPLETCLRTGFDLTDVAAGYTVERDWPDGTDGETLSDRLLDSLQSGTNRVVLGPPGSGKSTACERVAYRWYQRDAGPVYYRESGGDTPFASVERFAERLRDEDGHALVVVEDAVRPEANATFRLAESLADRDDVTFLFDARADEWERPNALPPDASLDGTHERLAEPLSVPPLTASDVDRLLLRIESETDQRVDVDPDALVTEVTGRGDHVESGEAAPAASGAGTGGAVDVADDADAGDDAGDDSGDDADADAGDDAADDTGDDADADAGDDAADDADEGAGGDASDDTGDDADAAGDPHGDPAPDGWLLLSHRLSNHVDPLGSYDASTPTTLVEDVEWAYDHLRDAGSLGVDVGVLVNLLNVAGVDVTPEFVYALALERGETDEAVAAARSEVDDALDVLAGRVVFSRPDRAAYRTVHEGWSVRFLSHFLETLGERKAASRFGWCVTALLALADERERLHDARTPGASRPDTLDRIVDEPTAWADATVEQLFRVGLERPGLAPLYGTASYSRIGLPDACSPSMEIQTATWRGRMYLAAGRLDEAARELRAALHLAEYPPEGADEARVTTLSARCHNELGTVANERGDHETATERYEEALALYREVGDRHGESKCLNNLGTLAYVAGDLGRAETYFEQSLTVDREIGADRNQADTLTNLGVLAKTRGDPERAEARYEEALALYREVGDPRDRADVLVNLGSVALLRGDVDAAETHSKRCLTLYRDIGYEGGTAHAFNHLGEAALLRGNLDEAAAYLERSLDCYAAVEDRRNAADARATLADVERLRGDLTAAESHAEESLEDARAAGDRRGEADALDRLAAVALGRGDLDAAASYAGESLDVDGDAGNVRGAAESTRLLGLVALERDETDDAEDRLREARSQFADVGDRYGEATARRGLAECAAARGDPATARSRFGEAARTFRELGANRDAVEATVRSGQVAREADDREEAHRCAVAARMMAATAGLDEYLQEFDEFLEAFDGVPREADDSPGSGEGTGQRSAVEPDGGDDGPA
ncbi:MAG: tetratricopeptide repeat protein [Haloferacaceae archaeon]